MYIYIMNIHIYIYKFTLDEQSNKSSGEREGDQRRYRLRDFMPIVDSPLPGRESVQKLYNLYKKKLLSRRS